MKLLPHKIALLERQIIFSSNEVSRMFMLVNSGYKMFVSEKVALDKYLRLIEQGEKLVKEYRMENGSR